MAGVAYFVGGIAHLIKALTIFMAIDYILGIMVAFVVKNVDSRKAILMVIAAVQLDCSNR